MEFITTDLHLHHKKLVERNFRPEGYEAWIAANWKSSVTASDLVICLGDVAMGKEGEAHETYIRPMPGRKILIRGNHDKQKDSWYLSHGWDEVYKELRMTYTVNGRHTRVLFTHIPVASDNSFDVNVHGHFHDDLHRAEEPGMQAILCPKHRLLSLELANYQMVPLLSFLEAGTDHRSQLLQRGRL